MKYVVFVLSPEKFTERRKHMSTLLKKASVEFKFVSIDDDTILTPDSIAKIHDKKRTLDTFGRDFSRGELASTLNHLLAYEKLLASDNEVAVILEDDANFDTKDFNHILSSIEKIIKTDKPQDCLLTPVISYLNHKSKHLDNNFKVVEVVQAWRAGYVVNSKAAAKMLDVNAKSWIICDDWVRYRRYANINISAVMPAIVYPKSSLGSNISGQPDKQRTLKYILSRNKNKLLDELKKFFWLIPFRGYVRNKNI